MEKSYVFYASFDEALRELPDKSRLKVYDAVSDYALRGIVTDLNGTERAIFTLIKSMIDRRKQRVENGKKGGRKKQVDLNQGSSEVKPYLNHTLSIPEPNLNQGSSEVKPYFSKKEEVSPLEKERSKEKDNTPQEENNFERKKEIDKDYHVTTARRRVNADDFSKMTDEELIAWGERETTDFTDSDAIASFYAWNEEMEKRATNATKWSGKIIKSGGSMDRLKSHAEVMEDYGVENPLRETLQQFLRHCYANRHLVTNEKLGDIIFRLDEKFGDDEEAKCGCVSRAISGGYFDVKA